MLGFGRVCLGLVRFFGIWSGFSQGLVMFGWAKKFLLMKIKVGFDQVWSGLVRFGQVWSGLVGFGRVWSGLVGFGQVWLSLQFH